MATLVDAHVAVAAGVVDDVVRVGRAVGGLHPREVDVGLELAGGRERPAGGSGRGRGGGGGGELRRAGGERVGRAGERAGRRREAGGAGGGAGDRGGGVGVVDDQHLRGEVGLAHGDDVGAHVVEQRDQVLRDGLGRDEVLDEVVGVAALRAPAAEAVVPDPAMAGGDVDGLAAEGAGGGAGAEEERGGGGRRQRVAGARGRRTGATRDLRILELAVGERGRRQGRQGHEEKEGPPAHVSAIVTPTGPDRARARARARARVREAWRRRRRGHGPR